MFSSNFVYEGKQGYYFGMTGKIAKILNRPIRMWIDGKCFNLKTFKGKFKKSNTDVGSITNVFTSSEMIKPCVLKQECIENTTNTSNDEEGKFTTSFELPKFYYQKLLAQKYLDDINVLSEKTNTKIIIPKVENDGKLQIVGENEENLQEALSEILSIIGHIRDNNVALQFATIPLISKEVQDNFERFKQEVLAEELENVDESIFFKKEKLHLTINIFVLHDEKELKEASNALNDFKKSYLLPLLKKTGPLTINIEGLDCMNSNYKKVNVLYAKANILGETEDANLQEIADKLSSHFYERGLLKRPQESVKIHMTLMNAKFRKIPGGRKNRNTKRKSFDASAIMEKFRDKFGTCSLNSIKIAHISANPGSDGFYKTLAEVNLQDCEPEPGSEGNSLKLNSDDQSDCVQQTQSDGDQNLQNTNNFVLETQELPSATTISDTKIQ